MSDSATQIPIGDEDTKVPFILGVTGHMDLARGDMALVQETLRELIVWLNPALELLPPGKPRGPLKPVAGLARPALGFTEKTPLLLLSSLAPGADHWAAQVAREHGIRVVAPLPFPRDQYARCSTFDPSVPAKPPPGDPAAQTRYEEKLARWQAEASEREMACQTARNFLLQMPVDDWFLVRLPGDMPFSDEVLLERCEDPQLLTGPGRCAERNERYGAAGEYIAAYSDLLLVITDPVDRERRAQARAKRASPRWPDVGAHGIAEVRRRGLTPRRLPIRPTLIWADSGPILRIDAYRRSTRLTVGGTLPAAGQAAWLFPLDSCPSDPARTADADEAWQARGLRELREAARNLEELNAQEIRSTPRRGLAVEQEWIGRLGDPAADDPSPAIPPSGDAQPSAGAQPAIGELRRTLQRLARLRRRVAEINTYHDGTIKGLRRKLFTMALLAAVCLAAYEGWSLPVQPGPRLFGATPLYRWLFFTASVGFTWYSFQLMQKFRGEAIDRTRTDYRAIAEGLRVQFYWTAVGTGKSVSSAYLQRQRGATAWIRAVVASKAFPYERNAAAFAALSDDEKRRLLVNVRHDWLGGQTRYFEKSVRVLQARRQGSNESSVTLLWGAGALGGVGFLLSAFPPLGRFFHAWCDWLLLAGLLAAEGLIRWAQWRSPRSLRPDSGMATPLPWRTRFAGQVARWKTAAVFPSLLVADCFPRSGEGGSARWKVTGLAVTALTLVMIGLVYRSDGMFPRWLVPPADTLLGFCKAILLSLGLLAGLSSSVHFLTTTIRSYHEMGDLFAAAGRRLDDHLADLDSALKEKAQLAERLRQTAPDAETFNRLTRQHQEAVLHAQEALANCQELLEDLGREALTENAEWLSMHRDRPIEPASL